MSYATNRERYGQLVRDFLSGRVDGPTFEQAFLALWRADRDEEYARKRDWAEPYDLQLQSALRQGSITGEEFSRRWRDLWGYQSPDDLAWREALDEIFSACDAFVADPALRTGAPGENDEDQFRAAVASAWRAAPPSPVNSAG